MMTIVVPSVILFGVLVALVGLIDGAAIFFSMVLLPIVVVIIVSGAKELRCRK